RFTGARPAVPAPDVSRPPAVTPRTGPAARAVTPRTTTPGTRSRRSSGDVFDWRSWWYFNRDRFLLGREESTVATYSADFFLGHVERSTARDVEAPTAATIHARVVPALVAALDSPDAALRASAARALARIDDRGAGEAVIRLLGDKDSNVRAAAAFSLGDGQ